MWELLNDNRRDCLIGIIMSKRDDMEDLKDYLRKKDLDPKEVLVVTEYRGPPT